MSDELERAEAFADRYFNGEGTLRELVAERDRVFWNAAIRAAAAVVKEEQDHWGSESEGRGDPEFKLCLMSESALRTCRRRLMQLLKPEPKE